MAYTPHYLLAFGGHLGIDATTESEHWSCTLRMVQKQPATFILEAQNESACLDDLTTDVQAFWADVNMQWASSAWLSWVKFNAIDANGRYAQSYTNERHFTPIAGTSTANKHPWQCSLVASFQTGVARGRAHSGRMFLPPQALSIGNDGLLTTGAVPGMLTAMKTFLSNVNNWPGLDAATINAKAAVCSKLDGSTHDITGIRIGRVVDTHRSRRRSLGEAYSTIAL